MAEQTTLDDLGYAAREYIRAEQKHAEVRRTQGLKPSIKWWCIRQTCFEELWKAIRLHAEINP